jgi:hypothetical protein
MYLEICRSPQKRLGPPIANYKSGSVNRKSEKCTFAEGPQISSEVRKFADLRFEKLWQEPF